jgi:hypothetical protein
MAIAAVANQLVCMVSNADVQLGMLKAKVHVQYDDEFVDSCLSLCL